MKLKREAGLDETRRALFQAVLAIPILGFVGSGNRDSDGFASVGQGALQPTPECADDDEPTPAQTEGPYFKRSSPERTSLLEPGLSGTPFLLAGQVLSTDCKPVARALLDFWQADDAGSYDLSGYRLRGHQFSDASGGFRLETIVPGLYSGRTRHLHVRVQAPNGRILTTQLYLPSEPRNVRDRIFSSALLMTVADGGQQGTFNFVLRT